MWELSAKGGEFGEGICSKISEGFGKAVGRSSVLAVLSGFGGAGWRRCRCRTVVGRAGACEAENHFRGGGGKLLPAGLEVLAGAAADACAVQASAGRAGPKGGGGGGTGRVHIRMLCRR
jgi:hypothetical protein